MVKKAETKIVNKENSKIIKKFKTLVKQLKFDIDNSKDIKQTKINKFRLRHIQFSLKIIKNYSKKITSGSQLKNIKGIGVGTIKRIDEILKTNELKEIRLNTQNEKIAASIDELEEIFGIGRKTAYDIVVKHKIKSIKDLQKAYKNKKIKLTEQIKMGLKYHGIYKQQIPRKEMDKIKKLLRIYIEKIDKKLIIKVCGSYRRKKKTSNDIDVLIVHPKVKTQKEFDKTNNYLIKVIKYLTNKKFIVDDLTFDEYTTKYMGFCQLNKKKPIRRIDIRYVPYESFASALLYFTGSYQFNTKMRRIASMLGYKLNEFGLFKIKNYEEIKIKTLTEKNIFMYLGMEYVYPKNR